MTGEPTQLWREYDTTHSEDSRNMLVVLYLPIVKATARRVKARLPKHVDVDDLVSVGVFGLMAAIDHFDLARGVKFQTFCSKHVHGAMLSALRPRDGIPRSVRTKMKQLERARHELAANTGRPPTDLEVAASLKISLRDLDGLIKANATSTVSLTRWDDDGDTDSQFADSRAENPVDELQRTDLTDVLKRELTLEERVITILYYFEGLTTSEISLVLDLSRARVHQIHQRALARLREKLGAAHAV